MQEIKKILIATDGSEYTKEAVSTGLHFAKILGAEVTALYVIDQVLHAGHHWSGGRAPSEGRRSVPAQGDLTIWIATNPLTRKVADIRRDPRVTLLYFLPATSEYVTVVGTATLDTDPRRKVEYWKPEWAGLYKNQNRGDDYQLLRVKPSRLEVVNVRRGITNDPKTWLPVIIDVP